MAERAVGEALDQKSQRATRDHRQQEQREERRGRGSAWSEEGTGGVIGDHCADHVDVAVREVDEAQDAIDHRVAERDQRVEAAPGDAVDELL